MEWAEACLPFRNARAEEEAVGIEEFDRLEGVPQGLAVEHRTTPCNCLSLDRPSGRSEFVPRKKLSKVYSTKKNVAISTNAEMVRFVRYVRL
jgi:hypothetical protein